LHLFDLETLSRKTYENLIGLPLIALQALKIGGRGPDYKKTFGVALYKRAHIKY